MSGHVPMRTCIGCRRIRGKSEMIRFVRASDGKVKADPEGRAPGRGAYLCADPSCLEKAIRRRAFGRAFGEAVDGGGYERLRQELAGAEGRMRHAAAGAVEQGHGQG